MSYKRSLILLVLMARFAETASAHMGVSEASGARQGSQTFSGSWFGYPMMGYGHGFSGDSGAWGALLIGASAAVGIIAAAVWIVRQAAQRKQKSAAEILNEQYARGELSDAEFEHKKKQLQG